jgi:predicted DNA-binding transcriptional regulator YafY
VQEAYEDVNPLRDDKAERIINLVMLLRSSKRGFTKSEIFKRILGYGAELNFDTASTMFERDKVELQKAGIHVDVYQADAYSEDEFRYRLNDEDALLPEIEFTEAETSALSIALGAWKSTIQKSDAVQAQLKLEGLGHTFTNNLPVLEMSGNQQLSILLHAISIKKQITFDYLKPGDTEPAKRQLEPWGVLVRGGSWFVYGLDKDRNADRVFNLNRLIGDVKMFGTANAYEIPADLDYKNLFQPHFSKNQKTVVRLRIGENNGASWRSLSPDPLALEMQAGEFDCLLTNLNLEIPKLAAAAPGVVVLSPADVVERVKNLVLGKVL